MKVPEGMVWLLPLSPLGLPRPKPKLTRVRTPGLEKQQLETPKKGHLISPVELWAFHRGSGLPSSLTLGGAAVPLGLGEGYVLGYI